MSESFFTYLVIKLYYNRTLVKSDNRTLVKSDNRTLVKSE